MRVILTESEYNALKEAKATAEAEAKLVAATKLLTAVEHLRHALSRVLIAAIKYNTYSEQMDITRLFNSEVDGIVKEIKQ